MSTNEKSERLIEAAAAILNAAPDHRLNAVVLNKALFYLDLASLRDRGELLIRSQLQTQGSVLNTSGESARAVDVEFSICCRRVKKRSGLSRREATLRL